MPIRRRTALGFVALFSAAACQGSPAASSVLFAAPAADRTLLKDIATDEYLVRLPQSGKGVAAMAPLYDSVLRHGGIVQHVYSERVGLADTLALRVDAAGLSALMAAWPALKAQPAVLRFLESCGDSLCDSDESATEQRSSTCSRDCGVPSPRAERDELANSWDAAQIGAVSAWTDKPGDGIHVGIIDSGYDSGPLSTHPDLPKNIVAGYNFPEHSLNYHASNGHGTHVAGIIAAPQNGIGRVGVAPNASLHIYNVFQERDGRLTASDADVIAALDAALADGCRIVNMSFGGAQSSDLEHQAIQRAYAGGVLLIAAAGNSEDASHGVMRTAASSFPAAYPEVVSVGATNSSDEIAAFSSTGPVVALAAPGVAVYSSFPVNSGDREVALNCQSTKLGAFALAAYTPPGGSGTPLLNAPLANCGFGRVSEIAACHPSGHIALISRGPVGAGQAAIPFADKVKNARAQGAEGVLLYNHRAGDAALAGALLTDIDIGGSVPVAVATLAAGDGEFLAGELMQSDSDLRCSIVVNSTSWAVLDGTSMAAPETTGVAALLAAHFPLFSNVQLRQLMLESAVDLGGPGRDDTFGWGRVDYARALAQAAPRASCGDGHIDRSSEVCDGAAVDGAACDEFGFDGTAGGSVTCNATCSGVDLGGCLCVAGRPPFELGLTILRNYVKSGVLGTLAFYQVSLGGLPVRGAYADVSLRRAGVVVRTEHVGPSDKDGSIAHFLIGQHSGLAPGTYEVLPVISKGNGRCHDDQPLVSPSFTIQISS